MIIFALITFLANLFLSVFIIVKNPRREINIILGMAASSLSFWTLGVFAAKFFSDAPTIILIGKLIFLVMAVCPFLILYFVQIYPNDSIRNNKSLLLYFIPVPLIIVSIFTPYFITGASNIDGHIILERGVFHKIWAVYFGLYVTLSLLKLFNKYRRSQALLKLQLRYVFIGFFLVIIGGFITNGLLPLLRINYFIDYGPLFSLPFIIFLSYSILRYRLLDIAIFIKKSLVYFVLVTFITGIYVLLILVTQTYFAKAHISVSIFFSVLSAFIIAVTLDPIKDWLGRITDKVFFKGKYNYYTVLKSLAQTLSSVIRSEELLAKVVDTISGAMRLDYTAFFIIEKNAGAYVTSRTTLDAVSRVDSVRENDPAVLLLSRSREPLIYDELDYTVKDPDVRTQIKQTFEGLKAKVFIPVILKEKLIGLLALGNKKSDDVYTQEDLDLLLMISNQISVVLENTNLYEQMLSTAKLALVGTMAAGIAHEIRNPLQPIKLFVQQLPERRNEKEFIDESYDTIIEQLNRLDRLTEELLNFSRSKPRAYSRVNINNCLEKVLVLFARQLEKQSVKVNSFPGEVPDVYADGEQINQVFINLILNGVQAMNGKGELTIVTGSETMENLLTYAAISIQDTGIGIPEQNLERIFDPFFTTKKEGTGLGLAICMKIVQEHSGFIQVQSTLNKGTKFKIYIPVYTQNKSTSA